MIVTCPDCATRFDVAAVALGPAGRKVRCVRCFSVWHQAPEPGAALPMAEMPPPVFAVPEPLPNFMMESSTAAVVDEVAEQDFVFPRRPAIVTPPKQRNVIGLAAWGSTVAAVLVIVAVAVLGRAEIVARWPSLNGIYEEVGLPAEAVGAGLELREVNSAIVTSGGKLSLVVAGEVANISSISRGIPPLTIRLRDGTNNVIATWKIFPRPGKLPPGETMPFQTSMASPPAGASSAVVTFEP